MVSILSNLIKIFRISSPSKMHKDDQSPKIKSSQEPILPEHQQVNLEVNLQWEEARIQKKEAHLQQQELQLEKKKSQLKEDEQQHKQEEFQLQKKKSLLKKEMLQLIKTKSKLNMRKALLECEQVDLKEKKLCLQDRSLHTKIFHTSIESKRAKERVLLQVKELENQNPDSDSDPDSKSILKLDFKPDSARSSFSSDSQVQAMKSLAELEQYLEVFQKLDKKRECFVDYLALKEMVTSLTGKNVDQKRLWAWINTEKDGDARKFSLNEFKLIAKHLSL